MTDQLQATVLLSERIWEDRGKVSLLGVGPTVVRAGNLALSAILIVEIEPHRDRLDIALTVELLARDDPARIIDDAQVRLEGEPPSDDAVLPERVQVLVPLAWKVDLAPGAMHAVRVRHDRQILTTTSFMTSHLEHSQDAARS